MERGERGKAVRRAAEAGQEREIQIRPGQVDAHEQRHRHAKENAEEGEPQIAEPDSFVVGREEVAGQEAGLRRCLVIGSAVVVVGHACAGETRHPPEGQLQAREQPSIEYIFLENSSAEGDG